MPTHAHTHSVTPDFTPQPLDVEDIRALSLSPRDAYLASLIDGRTSVADLAAVLGEAPREVVRRWLRLERAARQARADQAAVHASGVYPSTLVDAEPPVVPAPEPDGCAPTTLIDEPTSGFPPLQDPRAALSSARELARGARAAELDGRLLEAVNLWRLALELHDSDALRKEHDRCEAQLREQMAQEALLESQITLVDE